jgi:hypothetical protein
VPHKDKKHVVVFVAATPHKPQRIRRLVHAANGGYSWLGFESIVCCKYSYRLMPVLICSTSLKALAQFVFCNRVPN